MEKLFPQGILEIDLIGYKYKLGYKLLDKDLLLKYFYCHTLMNYKGIFYGS